ncbi:MAG TPA: hypothetical protein VHO29_07085 [Marmoricola sp.]|nr:hypothetical protein [Marmoricola sp.]
MTTRTQQAAGRRWVPFFLAALAAILAATSTSASAAGVAETRVRASSVVSDVLVEPPQSVVAGQRLGNEPAQVIQAVATGVAAEDGVRALPRDASGRFTSGAGGESAATAAGRSAHANYEHTLGGGDYVFNRALPGSLDRPDAVSYSQNIVRELKPDTPSSIAHGWRQVNRHKAYLEDLTDEKWTAYVDVYTP